MKVSELASVRINLMVVERAEVARIFVMQCTGEIWPMSKGEMAYMKILTHLLPMEPYSVMGKKTNRIYFAGTKEECQRAVIDDLEHWDRIESRFAEVKNDY